MATFSEKDKIMKLSQAEYTTLSTTGTLTKDGVTYTYSPSDTIYVTPDAYSPLVFSNLSVASSDWVADSTYSGLGYKAVLTCTGVTASMQADVYLSSASASLNIVAPFCDEGTDSVTIYSTSNDAITIDKVVAI